MLASVVLATIAVAAAGGARAQEPKICAGKTYEDLKKLIGELETKVNAFSNDVKSALHEEIKRLTKAHLDLLISCAAKYQAEIDKPTQPSPIPQRNIIQIKSAWYGDPKCVAPENGESCPSKAIKCDASKWLKSTCIGLVSHVYLYDKDKKNKKQLPVTDKNSPNTEFTYADQSEDCTFTVSKDVCFGRDPSPDSNVKVLKLEYACSTGKMVDDGVIVAADSAAVRIVCPQSAAE